MRLKDNVAIVPEAGQGIGRATALTFAKESAKVVICDIDDTARYKRTWTWSATPATRRPESSPAPDPGPEPAPALLVHTAALSGTGGTG